MPRRSPRLVHKTAKSEIDRATSTNGEIYKTMQEATRTKMIMDAYFIPVTPFDNVVYEHARLSHEAHKHNFDLHIKELKAKYAALPWAGEYIQQALERMLDAASDSDAEDGWGRLCKCCN